MIKIDISKNRDIIKSKHYKDIVSRSNNLQDVMELKEYSNLYNHMISHSSKGEKFSINFEKLVCASSKKDLLKQISIFENLIQEDSKGNQKVESNIRELIFKIFSGMYDRFSKREWAYDFLRLIEIEVCPYCNRNFATVVKWKQKPEFDHYFPKGSSKYPYLAISIFNLIPCCSKCNTGKSDSYVDINAQKVMYPYEEEFGDNIVFTTEFDDIDSWFDEKLNYVVKLNGANKTLIDAYNKAFSIDELYSLHCEYAKEIVRNKMMFDDDFMLSIYRSHPKLFSSIDEVREQIYGNYLSIDKSNRRPLSKLTRDILNEIENY